jgi:hypothetical protein
VNAAQGLRSWNSRPWAWLLGIILGIYVLYVGAASAFVSFNGMTWVTQSEEDIRIDVETGYSLFPGRFHIKGLRVQFKDYNVEMLMSAEKADLNISLHELLQKRIHLHSVRAQGAEFRTFHRVKDREKSAARLALFPSIPAFDRPPYYDAPRPPRSDKKPWSLWVDSVEAEAHTVWVMEFRLRGKISGKGAFYTDPEHEAEVLPCDAQLDEATLFVGDEQIASNIHGALSFALSRFTVRDAPVEKVLPKISAQVTDLSAHVDTLSFTKLYFSTEPLHLEGKGALQIDVSVSEGKIKQGSTASLSLSPVVISAQDAGNVFQAPGDGRLSFQVVEGGQMKATVQAQIPPGDKAPLSVERLHAHITVEQRGATQFYLRSIQWDLKSLKYGRPDFFYALFKRHPAVPLSGTFHTQGTWEHSQGGPAQLEAKLQTLSTSFFFEGRRIGATTETAVNCSGQFESALCGFDFHAPYILLEPRPESQAVSLWARLQSQQQLQVNFAQGSFEGAFIVSAGDPKEALSEWIGRAWLPQMGLKLVPTGTVTGSFKARRVPGQLSLSEINITSGKTQIEGELTSGKKAHAIGTIKLPAGRWGFETTPEGVRVRPFIGRKWLERQ